MTFQRVPDPIPARMRGLNRAEICDVNFQEFVRDWSGTSCRTPPQDDSAILADSALGVSAFRELFESQLISRHLDLMARVLRVQNKVFYTIGSSGHEGNALVGRLTRHTDPAFLHYRSGAFMAERSRKVPGLDPVLDSALSLAASRDDPASGGRHKVWGSKPLWVLPQTSTIASHLPKALGTAMAIGHARRIGHVLPVPDDSIVVCSFGDASSNHATAQTAFNAAAWASYQGLPAPVLFVCEDNGIGISVRTPEGWVARNFSQRAGLDYFAADGLDLAAGFGDVQRAVEHCRRTRRPTFLHLRTTRLMGHAGTDFEIEWRALDELCAAEASDPLLRSASIALESGVMSAPAILELYAALRARCFAAAEAADRRPRLTSLEAIIAPLAPYSPSAVRDEAIRCIPPVERAAAFGGEDRLPEHQPPRHLAIQLNQCLHDLLLKYPEALLFGEDVAQKGGVYTVTKGLQKALGGRRVFNTLLDETMILGMAQGYANMGLLPLPEIQYLAYFHNACDQIRGEAASLQFFSNGQYRNPMVVRVASLGYQRGFGGHFHNDNSVTALRDIPGLVVGCPSRGDDAVTMLRTLMALARVDGRVCMCLEPIALYMTKDLYPGDGAWLTAYPPPDEAMPLGEPRVYDAEASDLLIITFGNGVPMSLRAAREIQAEHGWSVRVLDLRWLLPLNETEIARHAAACARVVVVDEGRRSAGVGEGIVTAIVEAGLGARPLRRVVGADTYTPLAGAALLVIPCESDIVDAARALV
ncbi:thiamine pyrophosphate-dependent enzyme [Luteimonas deserti]|uniref:3-methyl-2-oxobutanoate dehydrogenase (2-methylpropanoyl-transferring) n=1 Tax=Luteimonas deserti TaxID=2752306 RepID=A0A7Z0TZN8_9GAMM|nr:thiamine pyrophosphate-dependent enzyme [Luteimonas deserti]NYZ64190.1 MFS transporter [Luteimonas deserti]